MNQICRQKGRDSALLSSDLLAKVAIARPNWSEIGETEFLLYYDLPTWKLNRLQ